MKSPNKITGANAGGPCPSAIRTPWAARTDQFRRLDARSIFRAPPSNSDMKAIPTIAVLSLLVVSILSACKHPPITNGYPPAKLASLIAGADRIVVTNRFADREPRYRGFSLTISGDEAGQVVRAVSSSEHFAPTDSVFNWDLRFYREAQFLADVHLQGSHFVFEGEEYSDGRVLERVCHDLLKRTGSQF